MKNFLSFIIGATIAVGALFFLQIKGCINKQQGKTSVKKVVIQKSDSIQHYKDEAGREHAKRMQAEAERDVADVLYGEYMDSIVKANDIQRKQLEGFTLVSTDHSDHVLADVDTVIIDSTKSIRIRYKDRWVSITGIAGNISTIDYSIKDSLVVSSYWKRKWLLGKKTTYVDAYSINPKVKVLGLQSLKISEDRRKPFGIGAYVGYGFDGTRMRPSVGIALTYDIIKF